MFRPNFPALPPQASAWLEGERVKGIEPSYAVWETAVLPLNYTRVVGVLYRRSICCPRRNFWQQIAAVSWCRCPDASGVFVSFTQVPRGVDYHDLLIPLLE